MENLTKAEAIEAMENGQRVFNVAASENDVHGYLSMNNGVITDNHGKTLTLEFFISRAYPHGWRIWNEPKAPHMHLPLIQETDEDGSIIITGSVLNESGLMYNRIETAINEAQA
jgi:hypothetical protein